MTCIITDGLKVLVVDGLHAGDDGVGHVVCYVGDSCGPRCAVMAGGGDSIISSALPSVLPS